MPTPMYPLLAATVTVLIYVAPDTAGRIRDFALPVGAGITIALWLLSSIFWRMDLTAHTNTRERNRVYAE